MKHFISYNCEKPKVNYALSAFRIQGIILFVMENLCYITQKNATYIEVVLG